MTPRAGEILARHGPAVKGVAVNIESCRKKANMGVTTKNKIAAQIVVFGYPHDLADIKMMPAMWACDSPENPFLLPAIRLC